MEFLYCCTHSNKEMCWLLLQLISLFFSINSFISSIGFISFTFICHLSYCKALYYSSKFGNFSLLGLIKVAIWRLLLKQCFRNFVKAIHNFPTLALVQHPFSTHSPPCIPPHACLSLLWLELAYLCI